MVGDRASHVLTEGSGTMSADAILDLCDGLLEEVGRRQHLFSWLRAPGASAGEWLPVDGYYPARRVVVVRGDGDGDGEHGAFVDELIAAHGLRLLRVAPGELGSEPEAALRARIAALELPPREVFDRSVDAEVSRDSALSRMSASLIQATAPPARQRARRTPRGAQAAAAAAAAPPEPSLAVGVVVGVALAIALVIELFVGIGGIALGSNPHWLLAFGFALDAVARALGTIAGERAGRLDWSLWSIIGGSPAVAAFTLFRQEGRMTTEPGPIAGLTSVIAMTMIGLWVLGSVLGL
jgi:hypothetical protein